METKNSNTVESYAECAPRVKHLMEDETHIRLVDESSSQFKTALTLNKYLESTYGCAGVSRESLFFYSRDVSSKPSGTCLPHMAAVADSIQALGIVCLVAGAVIQLIWWLQYFV